jgi:membrane fusion protein (multidrug efflux system)
MKRPLMLAGLFALFCYTSCTTKTKEKEEKVNYKVTNPLKIDTTFTKEYVSQIKSVRNIEIRAQEKGYLQQIYVDEGQQVKAGQVLFKINPVMYEAEYLKAKAEQKSAEIEMQNTKLLADKNVVAKSELAMALAKLEQTRAQVSLAKMHLSYCSIRAPFDGTIDRIPKKLGSMLEEGELLTSLSDNSQMFAYFNVSEPEYLNYQTDIKGRADKKVSLKLANNETLNAKGDVETVEGEFDNETGNIAFRARFSNPNRLLRNGETGKVLMNVPLRHALIIPQKATYEIQDKVYVFVIDQKGIAHSRNITLNGSMPNLYIVSGGLAEGDHILVEGVQKVKDDEQIKYSVISPKEVITQLQLKAE